MLIRQSAYLSSRLTTTTNSIITQYMAICGAVEESCAIEGFHVTSYQANFASHPTRDRHVGFLSHGQV